MNYKFLDVLEVSPVIAAVKDDEGVDACLKSESQVVFILYGDICTIPEIVSKVKAAGKLAVVHLDLIHGLASKNIAADFIKKYTEADGVISTKPTIIHRAKELGMLTVLRVFLIDSMAYENVKTQVMAAKPDVVEVLPGMMQKSHFPAQDFARSSIMTESIRWMFMSHSFCRLSVHIVCLCHLQALQFQQESVHVSEIIL